MIPDFGHCLPLPCIESEAELRLIDECGASSMNVYIRLARLTCRSDSGTIEVPDARAARMYARHSNMKTKDWMRGYEGCLRLGLVKIEDGRLTTDLAKLNRELVELKHRRRSTRSAKLADPVESEHRPFERTGEIVSA